MSFVILSYIYCSVSLIVSIVLFFMSVKYCKQNRTSRDPYTILTFIALIITLFIRGMTIVPIIILDSKIHYHESLCLEAIFNGTPLMLFIVATVINTARWYEITSSSLLTNYKAGTAFLVFLFIVLLYYICLIVGCYIIFCSSDSYEHLQQTYISICAFSFFCIHIILILLNMLLIVVIKTKLKANFPILYRKLRVKFFVFFSFIVFLLAARLAVFSVFYYFQTDYYTLVVTPEEGISLITTELIPSILMIFGFILFTGQTENSLDVLETATNFTNEETESLIDIDNRNILGSKKPKVFESVATRSPNRTDKLTQDLKNYINSEEDSGTLSHHSRQTVDLNKNIKGSNKRNTENGLQFRLNNSSDMKTTTKIKI